MNRSSLGRLPLVAGVILLLVAVCLASWQAWSRRPGACRGEDRVVTKVPAVFDDGEDPRVHRLRRAAATWGLGEVIASVGYDHDRWLALSAAPGGIGAQTRGSRAFRLLDESLKTRWGLAYDAGQHTWDMSEDRFVSVHRPDGQPPEVSSHRLSDGGVEWCRRLEGAIGDGDRLRTVIHHDGVTVLARGRLTRLDADGEVAWTRPVERSADSLINPDDAVLVAGSEFPQTSSVLAVDESGKTIWSRPAALATRVAGVADGLVVVVRGARVVALDAQSGAERWRAPAAPDVAVRPGAVLLRSDTAIRALDPTDGTQLWSTPVRQRPQAFPYGFQLDAQPMLDEKTMLLAGTDALVALDLTTGAQRRHALPTDGINTTFWPYQVVVSGDLIGVATNTGGLVLRR